MPKRRTGFDFGETRECPRCHHRYPTDLEHVGEHWYRMKTTRSEQVIDSDGSELFDSATGRPVTRRVVVYIPSTYCIDCEKARVAESNRIRRGIASAPEDEREQMAAQLGGKCECCERVRRRHQRRLILRRSTPSFRGTLCYQCETLLRQWSWSREVVEALWRRFFIHCSTEESWNRDWSVNHDRRRVYHSSIRTDQNRTGWRVANREDYPDVPYSHMECQIIEVQARYVLRFLERISTRA